MRLDGIESTFPFKFQPWPGLVDYPGPRLAMLVGVPLKIWTSPTGELLFRENILIGSRLPGKGQVKSRALDINT